MCASQRRSPFDRPPRIQSLALESALPPSQQISRRALQAASLLDHWDEASASELIHDSGELAQARQRFALAALDLGKCRPPYPRVSDGVHAAIFQLSCERGELQLSLRLAPNGEAVEQTELSIVEGEPHCLRWE